MESSNITWYMYVIVCCDDSLYCGVTTNLERRLRQHNGVIKGGAKYTRSRRPCKYVYKEEALNRSDACKKEYRFKKLKRKRKLEYIDQTSKFKNDMIL